MSGGGFLIVIVLVGLAWVLLVMPIRRRRNALATAHEAMQDSLQPGDEIITAGGLYALVREVDGDRLRVEIADGVLATLDRRAVAAVATDEETEAEAEIEAEPS